MSNEEKMLQDCLESCKEEYQENSELREKYEALKTLQEMRLENIFKCDCAELRAENERLKAQEEGAKIAYQTLIDEKELLVLKLDKANWHYRDSIKQIQNQNKQLAKAQAQIARLNETMAHIMNISPIPTAEAGLEMACAYAKQAYSDIHPNCWPLENSRTEGGI